jgi:hypothetical protein
MRTTDLFALFCMINFLAFVFNMIVIGLQTQLAQSAKQCKVCNRTFPKLHNLATFLLRNGTNGSDDLYIAGSEIINLKFRPIDIYRLDPTCEMYLALGGRISTKYLPKPRICTNQVDRAKLDKEEAVIDALRNQILHNGQPEAQQTPAPKQQYEPFLENDKKFNPFKYDRQVYTRHFSKIKVSYEGGFFTPFAKRRNLCEESSIDYLIFVVAYSEERYENLKTFLINMHKYLQTQETLFKYKILVVEQTNVKKNEAPFNKGRLYNMAYRYLMDRYAKEKFTCLVFHDVDLIPSKDSSVLGELGDYKCRMMPWHLSQRIRILHSGQEFEFHRYYAGGVLSLLPDHFLDSNGFSNNYFGWGADEVI